MINRIPRLIKLLGLGCLSIILILEICLRMLPVTTGLGYQNTTLAEPILRATLPVVKHSLDWKFYQSQSRKVNNYGFPADLDYQQNTNPIAVIGDSYIQSLMLPYADTFPGQLGTLIDAQRERLGQRQNQPVYSFGVPGYSLAGYIGSAEYVSKNFQPRFFIFLLTKGDITDSLSTSAGFYFLNSRNLELDFQPNTSSHINRFLLKSSLMRYLNLHLQFNPINTLSQLTHYQATDLATTKPLDLSQVSTRLLDQLEQKSTVRPDNTIFIIDCDRDKIYHGQPQPQTAPDNQLSLFAKIAQARGYGIVDTLPLFSHQYQKSHRRLDFKPIDMHWNRDAHQLVAEAVYPVIKTKLTRIAPQSIAD
jgi:hypothetical protein